MSQPEIATGGVRAFFEQFQTLSAASDTEGLAAMYAGQVMIAGPNGAQVVSAADLMRVIPKRKQLLESIGCENTALAGFEETPLAGRYSLVRAQFQWRFQPADGPSVAITLPSTFVVDRGGDAPQIVLYMNEKDVVTVLRERGLLPPA